MTYLKYVLWKEWTFSDKYVFQWFIGYYLPHSLEKWCIEPCFKGKIGNEGIELLLFILIFLNVIYWIKQWVSREPCCLMPHFGPFILQKERTILFKNNIIIIEQLLQFVEWMNIHAFSNIRNCVLVLYNYVNVMNFTENGKDQWYS